MRTLCVALLFALSGCIGAPREPAPELAQSGASVLVLPALRPDSASDHASLPPIDRRADPTLPPRVVIAGRPVVPIPSPRLKVEAVTGGLLTGGHHASGTASFYCSAAYHSRCTRGYGANCLCAAAGPELRVGDWRGRLVVVQRGSRRVTVRLVDCNCGPNANLIDLYGSAFEVLAHYTDKDGRHRTGLDKGVLKVTVTWP